MAGKDAHMTLTDRQLIEKGIANRSSKKSIADVIGKNKSTITREIKNHRILKKHNIYPIDCENYARCKDKNTFLCNTRCQDYKKFTCSYRDRSPGACNGCESSRSCHFDKYIYDANKAHNEYKEDLSACREGVNATVEEIRTLGNIIKPCLDKGQSIYVICQNHPEITVSEQTLYNYIENRVFKDAGVDISNMDLKRKVSRKMTKSSKTKYSPRTDRSFMKGRTYTDFKEYIEINQNARIVEMDTVYNNMTNGPFIQTFKFLEYDLLFCVYHTKKTSEDMLKGILLLESILGKEIFNREVEVLLTDRGSEFYLANQAEQRDDGTRRTKLFYCDSMCSWQKGSLENIHGLLRDICPKGVDLYKLGLTSQEKANRISININSYPKEKLKGKTSFQLAEFYCKDMVDKFATYGIKPIDPNETVLKPYLLK